MTLVRYMLPLPLKVVGSLLWDNIKDGFTSLVNLWDKKSELKPLINIRDQSEELCVNSDKMFESRLATELL